MWNVIAQAGLAGARRDFTDSLSLLFAGLAGLVWLSAALVAFLAVQDYWSQTKAQLSGASPDSLDHQEAA